MLHKACGIHFLLHTLALCRGTFDRINQKSKKRTKGSRSGSHSVSSRSGSHSVSSLNYVTKHVHLATLFPLFHERGQFLVTLPHISSKICSVGIGIFKRCELAGRTSLSFIIHIGINSILGCIIHT